MSFSVVISKSYLMHVFYTILKKTCKYIRSKNSLTFILSIVLYTHLCFFVFYPQ